MLPMQPDTKLSEADKALLKSYLLAKSTKDAGKNSAKAK